jgi:hypothetical protein
MNNYNDCCKTKLSQSNESGYVCKVCGTCHSKNLLLDTTKKTSHLLTWNQNKNYQFNENRARKTTIGVKINNLRSRKMIYNEMKLDKHNLYPDDQMEKIRNRINTIVENIQLIKRNDMLIKVLSKNAFVISIKYFDYFDYFQLKKSKSENVFLVKKKKHKKFTLPRNKDEVYVTSIICASYLLNRKRGFFVNTKSVCQVVKPKNLNKFVNTINKHVNNVINHVLIQSDINLNLDANIEKDVANISRICNDIGAGYKLQQKLCRVYEFFEDNVFFGGLQDKNIIGTFLLHTLFRNCILFKKKKFIINLKATYTELEFIKFLKQYIDIKEKTLQKSCKELDGCNRCVQYFQMSRISS